ncbi:endospore germination permease [Paenibacillus provencensis]|uniref:Endospore germination permease n=1 Tax=Paenibacillus provencensis TaxID=441151 RepID=A0ABW3PXR3_9BACL|nr:endospore germination permease [Paenibacillus sp. MER 78]MCM3128393.1 endospore germination permease [Paenibacillus sp. MER 78]
MSETKKQVKKNDARPITERQLVLMIIMVTLPMTLVHSPSDIVQFGQQHAYLCIILVYLILLICIWLLSKTQRRFGSQNLFQAMIGRQPFIGRVIVVLYIFYYFYILARDARLLTEYVDTTLLPLTPVMIILLCIFSMSGFIIRGGMKSVVGMTEIFMPILIITIFTIPLFVSGALDFHYLKPFLPVDMVGVMNGAWYYFSYAGEVIILPFIFGRESFKLKSAVKGVSFAFFLLVLDIIIMILIIGLPIIPRITYPSHELVRQVQISDFLDRFDMFLAAAILPIHMTKVAFNTYVICYGMGSLDKNISGRMMQGPIILLGYVCAFWFFKDSIQLFKFDREWSAIVLFFTVVMPVLIFLIFWPSKKKKNETNPNKQSAQNESSQNQQSYQKGKNS